jgi:hypothetical protein
MYSFFRNDLRNPAKKIAIAASALLALGGVFATSVQAAPVVVSYQGIVDTTLGGPAFDAFLGETIQLDYTFENTTPDSNPTAGLGAYINAASSMSVTVGGYSATAAFGNIQLSDVGGALRYRATSANPIGADIGGLVLSLFAADFQIGPAFLNDNLPPGVVDPDDFSSPRLFLGFASQTNGDIGLIRATLNTETGTVPEPATLALLGLGLAAFGVYRHKRVS